MLEITGYVQIFFFGFFGGMVGEAMKWYKLRESKKFPVYLHSPYYWGITFIVAGIGGIWAILYGVDKKAALLVVNIGLTAPLTIMTIMNGITQKEKHKLKPTRQTAGKENTITIVSTLDFLSGR